ncbi:Uncharacterized protein HZ326_27369 [Fusarium oxysporum f. sp. albedinis]|nr:Uncharacterized protein HZ326_27369 [Fusarium oxysporum f. sp. albedinis]
MWHDRTKENMQIPGSHHNTFLTWKQHIDEIQRKVTKTVNALSSLGGSTWGVAMREMRKIYEGVAVPQMIYACSASKLQSLQARASRVISGAYKATSIPALDVETYLLPIDQQIFKHNVDTLGRVGLAEHRRMEEEARRNKRSPRRAIEQGRSKGNRRNKVLIYTDNQAAIRSTAKPKGESGA